MASPARASLPIALTSAALALYLRFVFATSRWIVTNGELRDRLNEGAAVVVFWHSRLCAMPHIFRHLRPSHMLISAHRDGELIARVIERLGFSTVRGSTARWKPGDGRPKDKGGAAALRQMIRILRTGGLVGITPDGPRGPRMRISPGTITLAALGHAPLIAVAYSSSRAIRFGSWDRFLLPVPFGRIHVNFAGPLTLPAPLDESESAQARRALEDMLNRLTDACDRAAGQKAVEPAPESADWTEERPSSRTLEPAP
jgi:lysophospholipid acyltransferase (LPLAT)-like uncharacterized protein